MEARVESYQWLWVGKIEGLASRWTWIMKVLVSVSEGEARGNNERMGMKNRRVKEEDGAIEE